MEQICEVVLDQAGNTPPGEVTEEEETKIELVEENGHLFLRGVKTFDVDMLLEEEREARLNELMGSYGTNH